MAQILPRFYQARVDIQALKQIRSEVDAQPEQLANTMRLPGDPFKLRGIPLCVQGGVGGHSPGTRPDYAIMSSDLAA